MPDLTRPDSAYETWQDRDRTRREFWLAHHYFPEDVPVSENEKADAIRDAVPMTPEQLAEAGDCCAVTWPTLLTHDPAAFYAHIGRLLAERDAERAKVAALRGAMEEAASAAGMDWLEQQLKLAAALEATS